MSDPVTNVAIEDVLSSIRRLVSEDARVRPGIWQPDQVEPDAVDEVAIPLPDAAAGRLVLTPALRVTEVPQAEAVMPYADAQAADAVMEHQDGATETVGHDGQHDAPLMLEPDHVPPAADRAEAETHAEAAQSEERQPWEAQSWEAAVQPEAESHADSFDSDHADEAGTAEEAPAATELEPLVLSGTIAEALAWEDHHDDPMQETAPRRAMGGDNADEFEDLEAQEAGFVTQVAATDDAANAGDFIFASTRDGAGRESAPAAAEGADKAQTATSAEDSDFLFREDETVLDEETLRELVAEIVRQELQGALGERITRNVRKLVRREIHRALTSHELE